MYHKISGGGHLLGSLVGDMVVGLTEGVLGSYLRGNLGSAGDGLGRVVLQGLGSVHSLLGATAHDSAEIWPSLLFVLRLLLLDDMGLGVINLNL